MTAMQWFCLASFAGAALFFAAGAATMELRRRRSAEPTPITFPAEDAATREARAHRLRIQSAEVANDLLRSTEQQLRRDLERIRSELSVAEGVPQRVSSSADQHQAYELDTTRTEAITARREVEQLLSRLRETEQQLAERAQAVRDLSTQNEHLKGRVSDAEGLRTEYVRLRTTATDTEYLKSEVARLESELRAVKIDALGGQRRRPARGSVRPRPPSDRSIGESLSSVIEQFSDSGTRSVVVADTLGFPLASSGDDALSLAAYAALLFESANRGKDLLPLAPPAAIEIVDQNGARVSVWTFDVENDRLLLVNLAVTAVDTERVESTLADLAAILTPTPVSATGTYT